MKIELSFKPWMPTGDFGNQSFMLDKFIRNFNTQDFDLKADVTLRDFKKHPDLKNIKNINNYLYYPVKYVTRLKIGKKKKYYKKEDISIVIVNKNNNKEVYAINHYEFFDYFAFTQEYLDEIKKRKQEYQEFDEMWQEKYGVSFKDDEFTKKPMMENIKQYTQLKVAEINEKEGEMDENTCEN